MTPESAAPAQELKLETEKKPEGVLIHCTGRIVSSTSRHTGHATPSSFP